MSYHKVKNHEQRRNEQEIDNRETSADVTPLGTRDIILEYIRSKIKTSAVWRLRIEYTGDGCSVPKDITSVQFGCKRLGTMRLVNVHY